MTNRYLTTNFAPVRDEVTVIDLPVSGGLPEHLDGRYLRIGPNPLGRPRADHHWFMGEGMVHGVRLVDGAAAWYRNRYVRSDAVLHALGETPRSVTWDNNDFAANTNVLSHAGQTLALVEAGASPYVLTDELDTVGPTDFDGTLRMGELPGGYSAHPHADPVTGELHTVSYNWLRGNHVEYTVRGLDGRIKHAESVRVGGSPMMHDFALTESSIVLFDLPVVFDPRRATAGLPLKARVQARLATAVVVGRNPLPDAVIARIARGSRRGAAATFPYTWDPGYAARLGVLPRAGGGKVRWFEIDPCFVYHTLNAYDDGDVIVLDVVRHDRSFHLELHGPDEGPTRLTRFTIDLLADTCTESGVDERAQEFPRIDERRTGARHRFGFSVGFDDGRTGDSVLRHDLDASQTIHRRLGPGREASEFCFVAGDGTIEEGRGLLIGYVFDADRGASDLVILDAETLEDVAAVHLPVRVPAGFHGNWIPTAST